MKADERPLKLIVRRTMRSILTVLLRLISALALGYSLLLLTALWADQNTNVAAFFGGHNIVLQVFLTVPLIYFLLGRVPFFRKRTTEPTSL